MMACKIGTLELISDRLGLLGLVLLFREERFILLGRLKRGTRSVIVTRWARDTGDFVVVSARAPAVGARLGDILRVAVRVIERKLSACTAL
jgi:hypothetical protein